MQLNMMMIMFLLALVIYVYIKQHFHLFIGTSNSFHGNPSGTISKPMEFNTTTMMTADCSMLATVIDDDGDNTMPYDGRQESMNVDDYGLFRKLQAFIFNFRLQKFRHIYRHQRTVTLPTLLFLVDKR
jgi:hypothetical protein